MDMKQTTPQWFFSDLHPGRLRDELESSAVARTAAQQQQLKISVAGGGVHFRGEPEQEKESIFRVTVSHCNTCLGVDLAKSRNTAKISELFQLRGKILTSSKAPFQYFLNYLFRVSLLK